MSSEHPAHESPDPLPAARSRDPRRRKPRVRGPIVAVACCVALVWAVRSLWEGRHPVIEAARELRSSNPAEREGAARGLRAIGPADPGRAIPPLVAALGDPVTDVRITAAVSLGAILRDVIGKGSTPDAVRAGVEGLIAARRDAEPGVRTTAVFELASLVGVNGAPGAIDAPAVIEVLAAALGDRDDGVRLAAIRAMAHIGPIARSDPPEALVALLDDRSAMHRSAAVEALALFPVPLDPYLPALLRGVEQTAPEFRRGYWWAFARMQPPAFSAAAVPGLVEALGSRSRIVRSHAARALYPLTSDPGAIAAIPALLPLLSEPIDPELIGPAANGPYRWNGWDTFVVAAEDLGRVAPGTEWADEVAVALTECVRSDQVSRWAASARALGAFGPDAEPAVPALAYILRKGLARADVQRYGHGIEAARALARIAPGTTSVDEAVDALTAALAAPPESHLAEMLAALKALPAFGSSADRAVPWIREYQRSPDKRLRLAAQSALAAIQVGGPSRPGGASGR